MIVRGVAAGLAGTTAMTATTWAERSLRADRSLPVDYDATEHVVQAAATVLHRRPTSAEQKRALFLLVHWGYGSSVAVLHETLRSQGLSRRQAMWMFYASCQAMAFTFFPTLGGTPPPWRWRRDVLVSSLGQHLVYAMTVSAVARVLSAADGSM